MPRILISAGHLCNQVFSKLANGGEIEDDRWCQVHAELTSNVCHKLHTAQAVDTCLHEWRVNINLLVICKHALHKLCDLALDNRPIHRRLCDRGSRSTSGSRSRCSPNCWTHLHCLHHHLLLHELSEQCFGRRHKDLQCWRRLRKLQGLFPIILCLGLLLQYDKHFTNQDVRHHKPFRVTNLVVQLLSLLCRLHGLWCAVRPSEHLCFPVEYSGSDSEVSRLS
mmetsp:Transcript_21618/g.40049  ORF Transcript_21618/g.40049 Transcript_21618/m.40049 type:complete len:223 (+) Transcript_21618:120-788(+)